MAKRQVSNEMSWEKLAIQGDIKKAIVSYVQDYDWVTFVELQHRLEPYITVKGNEAIELFPNGIVWLNMSEELSRVLSELMTERALFLHPADPFTYITDGGMPNLPVAKRKPMDGQGYRQPRWVPCCIRTVPPIAAKHKKK